MSQTLQFCTFHLDRCLFGVEVHKVQEVIRDQEMTAVPLAPEVVRGLINLRGQIVTAIDMRRRLGHAPLEGAAPMNVVLRTEEGAISLLVDEIGDVVEVEDDTLERPPENISGVARELVRGVVRMENELLLVLDADRAIDLSGDG